jgi:DNA-binding PadR family transcriptional regulator
MYVSDAMITGPLQTRIMVALREKEMSGKSLMKALRINSPGTIYPVLEILRERGLISYRVERLGSVRKKISFLTDFGKDHLRRLLMSAAKWYCCDVSIHMSRILSLVEELIDVGPEAKVLSTFEHESVSALLPKSKITFFEELPLPENGFDLALSFLGVGCIMGKESEEIKDYATQLYCSLIPGGNLLIVEIEKTDNMFAEILFSEMFGLVDAPGMTQEETEKILNDIGFEGVQVRASEGIIIASASKPHVA